MQQEIFADGISAIHVTGQMVRIDLVTVQPQHKSDNGQPVLEMSARLVMPLEGFAQSLAVLENIVGKLIETGVFKRTPPEQAGIVSLADKQANNEPERE